MGSMKAGMLAARKAGVTTAPIQLGPRSGRLINEHGRESTSSGPTATTDPLAPSINEARREPSPHDE